MSHAQQHITDEKNMSDLDDITDNLSKINNLYQEIVEAMSSQYGKSETSIDVVQEHLSDAFIDFVTFSTNHPDKIVDAQFDLYKDYISLFTNTAEKMLENNKADAFSPPAKDRRFNDETWNSNLLFDFIKQSYLVNSAWIKKTSSDFSGQIDTHASKVTSFYMNHFVDALSPSNFLFTNPEAIQKTLHSNGENLVKGLQNLLHDISNHKGAFTVSMCDPNAFTIGKDIACTTGEVVYQNDLMQLIQYSPTTEKVFETPIFIIAPWINKYYILDMQAHNSLTKWLVDQGHTVFITSWANPDSNLKNTNFEDYLQQGVLEALDVIENITGQSQTNLTGYCLGGTLAAIAGSYLKSHKQDHRIKSLSFLTTLIDFTNPGDLGLFVDDIQLEKLSSKLEEKGYFNGQEMSNIFRLLRANDLIWSFVVKNYLFGDSPFAFDLLYWNSDSTNLPSAMHLYYLTNMYHKNLLSKPNALSMLNTPINVSQITTPCYMISTIEDHIAPWKSTYASTQLYQAPMRFVLSESGHVAGIVNPPSKKKYGYWVNDTLTGSFPEDADQWLETATAHKDSWWTDWQQWLTNNNYSGKQTVPARTPGSKDYPILETAPGSYVKKRVEDIA